jgi:thioredoxin reductase (NADPH)
MDAGGRRAPPGADTMGEPRNVIIIGSGPAGLTAAIYAGRANLKPLIVEGLEGGGQLTLTTLVENFPGFRDGVMGPDLMADMRAQAERFDTEIRQASVTSVDLRERPFTVVTDDGTETAKAVIIATGASARLLGLPSERALLGRGVSTCATCDGPLFRDRRVAIVGGGDSALEEALFLAKFASHVTVIHRRDALRASKIMQDKVLKNSRIAFAWNSVIERIEDAVKGIVEGVVLRNTVTGQFKALALDGVFVAIGHTPNTALFEGQIEMDGGYIVTRHGTRTSVPGVFACGDVQDRVYRQAITAAASGCMAGIDAERYLDGLPCDGAVTRPFGCARG